MSKRRKRHHTARAGGGRVTPKGTRPDGTRSSGGPAPGSGELDPFGWTDPLADHHEGFLLDGLDDGVEPFDPDGDPIMEMIGSVQLAASFDDPVQLDLWAAELIGVLRAQLRPPMPWEPSALDAGHGDDEMELPDEQELFAMLAAGIGSKLDGPDGPTAALALHALIPYLPDEAAEVGRELLRRSPAATPDWAGLVGHAAVEECFVMDHETDDGHNLALVARYPDTDRRFLMMLLVDVNLGRLGKDILLTDAIDEVRASGVGEGFLVADLAPPVARARVEAALEMTDMTISAPVADDFDELRPLLERLLDSMPEPAELEHREPPTDAELDQIAGRLAAEVAPSAPEHVGSDDLYTAAQLMCGFTSRFVGCDPLAWTPTRLELFLLDHVPRRIAAPPEELVGLPEQLALLAPAAHRRIGWDERYLEETLETIELCGEEFNTRISSPEDAGPAKAMMLRALAEGIDLEDPAALDALVDRVNSTGGVDAFGLGLDLMHRADQDWELDWPLPEAMDTSAVPEDARARVARIDAELMRVAVELFDPEHLEMSRSLLVRMANEHPEELVRGAEIGWAGGIPYALCQINKVFTNGWRSDLGVQAQDLVEVVGVSQVTLTQRAKLVRTLFELDSWPPPEPYFRSDVRRRVEAFGLGRTS